MADTKHAHAPSHGHDDISVEGDGISYRGIIWFVVIMALTVVGSQALMAGTFKWFEHEVAASDQPRAPLSRPQGQLPPGPNLMRLDSGHPEVSDPGSLAKFREEEDQVLTGYAYDAATGKARIPIDRAKALLLQRGLPSRAPGGPAAATPPPAAKK